MTDKGIFSFIWSKATNRIILVSDLLAVILGFTIKFFGSMTDSVGKYINGLSLGVNSVVISIPALGLTLDIKLVDKNG